MSDMTRERQAYGVRFSPASPTDTPSMFHKAAAPGFNRRPILMFGLLYGEMIMRFRRYFRGDTPALCQAPHAAFIRRHFSPILANIYRQTHGGRLSSITLGESVRFRYAASLRSLSLSGDIFSAMLVAPLSEASSFSMAR